MLARDYKQIAKSKLTGNWGKFALLFLVESLIIMLVVGSGVMTLLSFLIIGPLQLGYIGCVLDFSRGKNFKTSNLFDGFDNFVTSFVLQLLCSLFVFLWSLLLIIPGIMASYSYSMSFYILRDDPRLKVNEARNRSIALMHGHKWQLFCLHFSFIGWLLLSILTLGILLIWVMPYIELATAEFYENIKK